MADIPITNNIRKVIFENFNEHDLRFNNDQIFENRPDMIDQSLEYNSLLFLKVLTLYWSGRRDSNPRLQPWQGCALPLSYARLSVFSSR